jgi:predicted RNase H-like HicB family nuclease
MRQYAVLIEMGKDIKVFFAPTLPGCVSVGKTWQEVKEASSGSPVGV